MNTCSRSSRARILARPSWNAPRAPRPTRGGAATCCAARATPGPRPAWTARPPDAYLRAAAAAREAGSAELLARAALGLGGATGFWSVELNRAVPTGLLAEALAALGPGDSPARARLLARLARWRAAGSRLGAEEQDRPPGFAEAVAMARRLGDPRALVAVLADQENAWHGALRPDGPGAAVAASAELDRLAADLDDEDLAYQASRARAGALLTAGDLDGVERLAEGEARLAETGAPHHRWLALRLRASTAMLRGNFADSERLAGVAFDLGRRHLGGPRSWPTAPSWCSCAGSRAAPAR
ncbi:MAG: hypothetical protein ACJ742_09990 [Actinomycetes bacterium]